MSPNSQKLERLLDALTEDIFNDIECAKAVINEAGFDTAISSTEGARKVAQLQEGAFRQLNALIVCDVGNYGVQIPDSFEHTIFRLERCVVMGDGDMCIKSISFADDKVESGRFSSSRHLDEEKLQLN